MENSAQSPHIVETTEENFLVEVVERSSSVPVVVDFWAEWCQPCRILGPVLERLAVEYDGRFVLAKADTEKLADVASGFGVRSIPAVFAVKGGKIVDSFVGAQPEATVRAWIERLMPTPAEALLAEARSLEAADPEGAEARYREALALAPDEIAARVGLGRMALALGRVEEARGVVEALERRGFLEPEAETLKAELTLRGKSEPGDDIESLRAGLAAGPGDHDRRLALAEALAARGDYEEALGLALDLVERDRRGTGEPARKLMLAAFQVLPPDSAIVADFRRRLSFAL